MRKSESKNEQKHIFKPQTVFYVKKKSGCKRFKKKKIQEA